MHRQRFVALLRGINVGGHRVKMDALRRHFEALRLRNVETFIASGNVIFDAPAGDIAAPERRIERHLAKVLGFEAPVFIRTVDEIATAVASVPFPRFSETDSLTITFLRTEPDPAAKEAVLALASPVDEFRFRGREVYWLCHGKISEVSLAWPKLEKLAKSAKSIDGTSRNITSVRKLLESVNGS
jgi:uncharacterized protein (DUF1697 family)